MSNEMSNAFNDNVSSTFSCEEESCKISNAESKSQIQETSEIRKDIQEKEQEKNPQCTSSNSINLISTSLNELKELKNIVDHTNLVATHYNSIKDKGLAHRNKSQIVYLRNFNNWIKSMLIQNYIEKVKKGKPYNYPIRVLDMCCGKGGDLIKWKHTQIAHLICADIAEISVEVCRNRYQELKATKRNSIFKAEFITQDCTKVRLREKYSDPSILLDLVSCQFAFHYSFESLPQAECMFKNASESLKPGGYFIGTIPNANELVSRWYKAEGNKFGNSFYNVEFQCDKANKIPLFGAKYNFQLEEVVNCPEFLVNLSLFRELGSKFGLELILFERFDTFYESNKENGRNLLKIIQALNTYTVDKEASLGTENAEYKHVAEYLRNSKASCRIGTLSKSEWEVITLYCVFAFQKAKTVWNSEGKPEFVKY